MLVRFVRNYLQRHTHPANQLLHVIGVPLTFGVSAACWLTGQIVWGWLCFVVGYALQFAGHAIEGNDAGEVVLVKRLLGLPYVEFAKNGETDACSQQHVSGKESKCND